MRVWITLVAVYLAMFLCSCEDTGNPLVPCLHPLYADTDREFDPALVGSWTDEDAYVTFTFVKQGDAAYKLTVTEPEQEKPVAADFEVHLVRIGSQYFLDFYPGAPNVGDDFYRLHLLPVHTIARITVEPEHLQLSLLDSAWLKKQMDNKSVQLDSNKVDGDVILAATTEELQGFVDRFATDDDAFPNPLKLHRAKPASEEGEQNADPR